MVPGEAPVPDLISVGLIVTGGLFFLGLRMFGLQALDNEPGDVSLVEGNAVPDGLAPTIIAPNFFR
jgi:hypothetical protein